jgi:hypothetical protein
VKYAGFPALTWHDLWRCDSAGGFPGGSRTACSIPAPGHYELSALAAFPFTAAFIPGLAVRRYGRGP